MNKYAYSGQEPTIDSSCQNEWSNHFIDDKSTQVGGTQVIITFDGYIMPIVSKEGLIVLVFLGKPTNADFDAYPVVHLTSTHPWIKPCWMNQTLTIALLQMEGSMDHQLDLQKIQNQSSITRVPNGVFRSRCDQDPSAVKPTFEFDPYDISFEIFSHHHQRMGG